jgi:hypothetical protein
MDVLTEVFLRRWPVWLYIAMYVIGFLGFFKYKGIVYRGLVIVGFLITFAPYVLGIVPWR